MRCPAQREITSAARGSGQRTRRLRTSEEPLQARPARAMAYVEGSGTTVIKPVAGLNVANYPAARPVAFTAEKLPERPPALAKSCSTSVPSA